MLEPGAVEARGQPVGRDRFVRDADEAAGHLGAIGAIDLAAADREVALDLGLGAQDHVAGEHHEVALDLPVDAGVALEYDEIAVDHLARRDRDVGADGDAIA